jgi:hypothetical protein
MSETRDSELAYCEGFSGPDGEYAWTAKISREPSEQGLDGGRIQYLNVHRWEDGFSRQVAHFQGGQFFCDDSDARIPEVLKAIGENFSDKRMEIWRDNFPREQDQEPVRISRSGRSRGDEGGRER